MQLTIALPDEMARRIQKMRDPNRFITRAIAKAFKEDAPSEERAPAEPSRWARLAQRVAEDPVHLDGYSEQLIRDAREFRDEFAFRHDREP